MLYQEVGISFSLKMIFVSISLLSFHGLEAFSSMACYIEKPPFLSSAAGGVFDLAGEGIAQALDEEANPADRVLFFDQLDETAAYDDAISYLCHPACLVRGRYPKADTERLAGPLPHS